jgi:hypothetical protein
MKPTLKEKVQIYENLLHLLHTHYAITLNSEKVKEILNQISNWSYAHRQGNGELSDKQQAKLVNKYLEEFKKLI